MMPPTSQIAARVLMGRVARSSMLVRLPTCLCALLFTTVSRGGDARPNALASYDALIKPSQRQHWAFQPVRRPAVPAVKNMAWVRNPVDAFILAKLEVRGCSPAPSAEPRAP